MSLLSLQTVTKIFGGLTAVNEVSFDVEQGSIVVQPDHGQLRSGRRRHPVRRAVH